MGNSLREQFLKAGLVEKKQVSKANKAQWKKNKQRQKTKANLADPNKTQVQKALAEKEKRDKDTNQKRQEKAQKKALAAQIKQLIEPNRLSREGCEIAYNFTVNKKIKKIHVSEEMLKKLNQGALAIVSLGGRYEIVPNETAEKIRERDVRRVIPINQNSTSCKDLQEDPYAKYAIPDDLMW